ncbi:MAG: acetyltransferase [Deltaproteobacteria bacterium RBG_16_71_12]|nr:MAG: acetyltransferase [Deltaproteobacteria bacterium RBG_16_71_12]
MFLSHRDSVKTKLARHRYDPRVKTVIGADVWIGEAALLKGGVTIGPGAVIGMGSVVTKDIEPYAIVAGNPARTIRLRFSPQVVDALLRMAWWKLSDEELRRLGPLFTEPERLLKQEGFL